MERDEEKEREKQVSEKKEKKTRITMRAPRGGDVRFHHRNG